MKKIDLSKLAELIAAGPAGREKQEKQARAISDLQETLMLMVKRRRPYEVPVRSEGNTIRFGLIGDTQIGSSYQRLDALGAFYGHCESEGIKIVLHAGDVLDGWKVYRGQEFELHPHGRSWPEQRDMFAEAFPRIEGITTILITGNHDASFKKLIGMVVGDELGRLRPDCKFVGQDIADVVLRAKSGAKLTVRLLHPGGGTAYAVSYHLQKIIESIAGGQKPDIIAVGHYHKALWVPNYRNISGFLVGCFQSQTPYMVQHSLAASIGGYVVTATLGDKRKLTTRIGAEFISFFEEQRA